VHFLFGLIFKYEATIGKGIGLRAATTRFAARADSHRVAVPLLRRVMVLR
jgi:hypothetical protein